MLAILMAVIMPGAFGQEAPHATEPVTVEDDDIGYIEIVSSVTPLATAIATFIFVFFLFLQLRTQRREHNFMIRPILVLGKDQKDDPPIKLVSGDVSSIRIRLLNIGGITTGRARVILFPLDDHAGFVKRKKAFNECRKDLKEEFASTPLCLVLDPIRERIKLFKEKNMFHKYLIVGEDLENILPLKRDLEDVLEQMGDMKDEFNQAGRERAISMAKLDPDEWDMFYQAGEKRGDLLDITGPIDWEHFDSDGSITRKDVEEILKEDAKRIYDTERDRKRILERMSPDNRKQFDDAIRKRQDIWNALPSKVTHDFAIASMNLRKAYKDSKDIVVKDLNLLPPNHPIFLDIELSESDVERINAGDYMYFGILIQYGKPNDKKDQFVCNLQGYFHKKVAHVDYILDELDG